MHTTMLCCVGRVLDRHHVLALTADEAQGGNGGCRILAEPLAVGRIGPGFGDHLGAVARSDLDLIGLNQRINGRWIDIAFLDQDGLECAHPQLDLGEMAVVVMIMVMMVVPHTYRPRLLG